jgi:arsenate reductase-like glutaredoxin family protein
MLFEKKNKTKVVMIKVTEDELASLKSVASQYQTSVSNFLREAAKSWRPKAKQQKKTQKAG